jgi:rhamnosyltransferase
MSARAAGDISAIVVTHHPKPEHLRNLMGIREQVDRLIIVDNGSLDAELAEIRKQTWDPCWIVLENGSNLGIATALNRGIREAQGHGSQWVVLFDQDSATTPGFKQAMISDFCEYKKTRPILQLIPRYRDPNSGVERPISRFKNGSVFLTITSGSLFPIDAFTNCGLFQEDLFIYCVDDDYSLRIHLSGGCIGVSKSAVLQHQSGTPTSRKFLGKTFTTKNYRPEVRYYYARNKVWILRRYARDFPRLIMPTLREFVMIPLKILWMEKNSMAKLAMCFRGMADGIIGKMGPLQRI